MRIFGSAPSSARHATWPVLFAAFLWAAAAPAQELEFAISPSPVGAGARAAGMADAFVAIADDATAASWNPAGLVQLELPELSLVLSHNAIVEDFKGDVAGFASTHRDNNFDFNYFSIVLPLPILVVDRNVTAALNYQRKYDFSRRFDVSYLPGVGRQVRFRFEQEGGLSTVTPAVAIELNKRLSLGVALNLWRSTPFDDNGWKQTIKRDETILRGGSSSQSWARSVEEYKDFRGENVTIGVLWNATHKLSLGARYDTAFTGKADFTRNAYIIDNIAGQISLRGALSPPFGYVREKRSIRFPDTAAFGAAYRRDDRLTLSADVTRTDWSKFYFKDSAGRRTSLIDAARLNRLLDKVSYKPTYTVRAGLEYVFVPKEPEETLDYLWTARGGLFYDQQAAQGAPDDFYGATAGVGLLLGHRVNIDAAYQFRWGRNVNRGFFRGIANFREDVDQHRFLLSTVVYF